MAAGRSGDNIIHAPRGSKSDEAKPLVGGYIHSDEIDAVSLNYPDNAAFEAGRKHIEAGCREPVRWASASDRRRVSNIRTVERQQCRTNSQICDSDVRYGRANKNRIQGGKVPLLGSSKNVSHCDP